MNSDRPDSGERESEYDCLICGEPATCIGRYEGHGPVSTACDTCCGHGNEDGWCVPVGRISGMRRNPDRPSSTESGEEPHRFQSFEEVREAYLRDPILYNFVHRMIAESHNSLLRDHPDPSTHSEPSLEELRDALDPRRDLNGSLAILEEMTRRLSSTRSEGDEMKLSAEEVEHIDRWAEEATPLQVAAAMREKLRLEKAADPAPTGSGDEWPTPRHDPPGYEMTRDPAPTGSEPEAWLEVCTRCDHVLGAQTNDVAMTGGGCPQCRGNTKLAPLYRRLRSTSEGDHFLRSTSLLLGLSQRIRAHIAACHQTSGDPDEVVDEIDRTKRDEDERP